MAFRRLERKLRGLVGALLVIGAGMTAAAFFIPGQQADPSPALQAESTAPPLPLSGWTILVDAGHGGYDGGARARDSGMWEKHLNLAVARETEKTLAARGARVIMTRREDEDLCEEPRPAALTKKRQDMLNRVELAVQSSADMVLSIHMNEYRDRSQSGPQVFYRKGSEAGRLLAGAMQEALIHGLSPKKQRSALPGDYFILQLEVPSVLIECGFISNPAEEKLLLSPDYQAQLAEAIADGAESYVTLRPRSTSVPGGTPPAGAR
ncbi:MAG: N-acetylmuramoyl-L-alanine amidase [Clostridia bacterium]|nr:N-acetylmuramoyl-L-alanine amidase [Clostridia bacterium]